MSPLARDTISRMKQNRHLIALVAGLLLLGACVKSAVAPVAQRAEVKVAEPVVIQRGRVIQPGQAGPATPAATPGREGYHIVARGDTLYSIAWRYNLDYRPLARWNTILAPYTIYPGQFIRLKAPAGQTDSAAQTESAATQKTRTAASKPKAAVNKAAPARKKPAPAARQKPPAARAGRIAWSWPASGRLIPADSPIARQGLSISGQSEQSIKTAAAGEVVYSGSGLRGYGKLIIIKHSEMYLSAYAHNSRLLVNEGDKVSQGQTISRMGQDASGRYLLHFEIRRNGKPVDPRKYLPDRRAG